MSEDFQEKTEEPTPKKLNDARKKGQVARSQEFTGGVLLIFGMVILYFFATYFNHSLQKLCVGVLNNLNVPYDSAEAMTYWFRKGLMYLALMGAPLLGGVFVVAFFVNALQVGLMITPEAIKPKWKNINCFNPSNYKKFFSTQTLMKTVLGLGKMTLVSIVCFFTIRRLLPEASRLMNARVIDIYRFVGWNSFIIGLMIAIFLLVLGVIDFAFQKWKFKNDMKMTKQEIKDERKQTEGDVQIKSKMRAMMQAFAQNRMKENVPHADVIIANPIHYAIAVKYDAEEMAAPLCVAKGARRMAIAIKEIAKEHNIPIVENPPLAQGLYKSVEVGSFVPPNFYHSVAEVLAYVYRLNEKLGKKIPVKQLV